MRKIRTESIQERCGSSPEKRVQTTYTYTHKGNTKTTTPSSHIQCTQHQTNHAFSGPFDCAEREKLPSHLPPAADPRTRGPVQGSTFSEPSRPVPAPSATVTTKSPGETSLSSTQTRGTFTIKSMLQGPSPPQKSMPGPSVSTMPAQQPMPVSTTAAPKLVPGPNMSASPPQKPMPAPSVPASSLSSSALSMASEASQAAPAQSSVPAFPQTSTPASSNFTFGNSSSSSSCWTKTVCLLSR